MTSAPTSPLAPIRGGKLALLTLAVASATFMEVLDSTIVNVSVPTISGNLGVSTNQGTWTISSYSVAAAIAVPLTGWLARRFGEIRMFVLSVVLFTLMSMLCGLATSLPMLVFFRLLQGLVSGPMVPLSQTILLANYPPQKKGLALALWSMTVIVAPIFGPLLGGYFTDNFSWPWIFYINAPVGLLAGFLSWRILGKRDTVTVKQPIDYVGLILLVIGVGALQLMLDNGNDLDWFNSATICALAATSVVALSFLIAWELTDKHPIVDLTLFKGLNFRVGVLVLSLGMMAFFGSTVLFPLWLQTVMGYTPTWSGLATAPVGILAFILSPLVGRNLQRIDLRLMSSFAFIIFALTMFWYGSFNLDTNFGHIIWPRVVQGIGVACFFVPVNQILLSGIPVSRMAAAAGLSNFFRTLSAGFATAISVTLWDHRATFHHARLVEEVNTYNANANDYINSARQLGLPLQGAYSRIDALITQTGFMKATSEMFTVFGWMFVVMLGLIWLTKPPFGSKGGAGGGH